MTEQQPIPDGYMRDAVGRLVPIGQIKATVQQRDTLVRDLVARCEALQSDLAHTKRLFLDDIAAHIALSAETLGVMLSGLDGSIGLTSFDGTLKVERAVSPRLTVSAEEILAAEAQVRALVDDLITDLAGGGSESANVAALRSIVTRAFRRNASGQIVLSRLLDFSAMEIDDPRWRAAQAIIRGAITVDDTVTYFRAYRRADPAFKWQQLDLDFSRIAPAAHARMKDEG